MRSEGRPTQVGGVLAVKALSLPKSVHIEGNIEPLESTCVARTPAFAAILRKRGYLT